MKSQCTTKTLKIPAETLYRQMVLSTVQTNHITNVRRIPLSGIAYGIGNQMDTVTRIEHREIYYYPTSQSTSDLIQVTAVLQLP